MTPTAARPNGSKDSHWYTPEGEPCYSITGKTTGKPRPVNITDARANGYLPGVSTILKTLHKEALVNWLIEQAVLACLTTPRKEKEELDAFIERVLHVERVQDEESQIARDRGTEIHDALEALFSNRPEPISEEIKPWVMPAYEALKDRGSVITTEQILVGDGYAGRTDLILGQPSGNYTIWDFKSAKKLPDPKKGGAWSEHRLQLSAYAQAFLESAFAVQSSLTPANVQTANLYISTVEQGKFVICEHPEWQETYNDGFVPLVNYWAWANKYRVRKAVAKVAAVEPAAEAPSTETAILETAMAEAKAESATPPAQPAPRKHKVSLDIGVPTIPQLRFAPMAPPPMPSDQ